MLNVEGKQRKGIFVAKLDLQAEQRRAVLLHDDGVDSWRLLACELVDQVVLEVFSLNIERQLDFLFLRFLAQAVNVFELELVLRQRALELAVFTAYEGLVHAVLVLQRRHRERRWCVGVAVDLEDLLLLLLLPSLQRCLVPQVDVTCHCQLAFHHGALGTQLFVVCPVFEASENVLEVVGAVAAGRLSLSFGVFCKTYRPVGTAKLEISKATYACSCLSSCSTEVCRWVVANWQ